MLLRSHSLGAALAACLCIPGCGSEEPPKVNGETKPAAIQNPSSDAVKNFYGTGSDDQYVEKGRRK